MLSTRYSRIGTLVLVSLASATLSAQTLAGVQGQVVDQSGAMVGNATIIVTNTATSLSQTTKTDANGNYRVPALPVGTYDVEVQASGLQRQLAKSLVLEVGRTTVQNFQLKVAQESQVVTVQGEAPIVESTTMTVGQVMDPQNVQQIPLNGRHSDSGLGHATRKWFLGAADSRARFTGIQYRWPAGGCSELPGQRHQPRRYGQWPNYLSTHDCNPRGIQSR
jgi:hypothetical protein